MGGRRVRERMIVIRSKGCISRAEIRQSILKYLLREYDMQKHTIRGHNLKERIICECGTEVAMGRGSGSDAGDRE